MQRPVFPLIILVTTFALTAAAKPTGKSELRPKSILPTNIDIGVQFDRTFYSLKLNDKEFSYTEGSLNLETKVDDCNRAKLEPTARLEV